MFLVSVFLPEVTQQIHSLRARGVMAFHIFFAKGVEIIAFRKSSGNLCTVLADISFLVIRSPLSNSLFKFSLSLVGDNSMA